MHQKEWVVLDIAGVESFSIQLQEDFQSAEVGRVTVSPWIVDISVKE